MSDSFLQRSSGLALLIGGLTAATAHAFHPAPPHDHESARAFLDATASAHLVLFAGIFLITLALPRLVPRQREGSAMAVGGYILLLAGLLLNDFVHSAIEIGASAAMVSLPIEQAEQLWMRIYSATPFARVRMVGSAAALLGAVVYPMAMRRTPGAARWPGVLMWGFPLLFVARLVPGAPHALGAASVIVFYLAFVAFGAMLLRVRIVARHAASAVAPA